jgi:Putative phage tail protein
MGFFRPKSQATKTDKINSIRVSQSVLAQTLPVLFGQQRLHWSLIWYGDFTSTAVTQQGGGAGKGLFGGGNSASTTYDYSAAIIGALAQGVIRGIVNVWDTKGRYQQASASENFTIPGGGGNHTVGNAGNFGNDVGVGRQTAYSQVVNDYGSPGPVTLSGTYLTPMVAVASAPGAGQYSYNPATGVYTFSAADAGKTVTITYLFNLLTVSSSELATIPSTPFQIAVQNNSIWTADGGVKFSPSGTALTAVASAPAAGQYSVAAGVYTFNSADTGKAVLISYQITDTAGQGAPTTLNFTLFPGTVGQAVWGFMSTKHPDQALGYSGLAYLASSSLDLGAGAAVPNYTFEALGPNGYGSGIADCNPKDCILSVLLDPALGVGANGQTSFPASAVGDFTQASNFWIANSFFISPLNENQRDASSVIQEWLEAGMTASFFSEGKLKLAPYGDVSVAGNGVIYQPDTQPVEDLDDDDFIVDGPGSEPIKVSRSPLADANNRVQIQWANRASGYNPEVTIEEDATAINRWGARVESPVSWDFITTQIAASLAASWRVKRSVNIRSTYEFRLGWHHSYLEPMNLVTLTTSNDSFFTKLPVRITKIDDDPVKGLTITAEDFPWGTATAALYAKQPPIPFFPSSGLADPGPTSALIIETPNALSQNDGNVLYIFCSGTNNVDWGGCDIYISFDNTEYDWFAKVTVPARIGTLASGLAAGTADPDTNAATVNMGSPDGILTSASQAAFDQYVPLAALFNPSPVASTTPVDLSAAYNLIGIYSDGTTFSGSAGLDGAGRALSSNLLGKIITFDGTPYKIAAANANNVVKCSGQTITLPAGKYQGIWMLITAVGPVNGQLAQTFTVHFSDATTQTITQSVSQWIVPQGFPGEFPAFNGLAYRNTSAGTKDQSAPSYVYNFSANLTPGKTVSSITLPNNANLMVVAMSLVVDTTTYNFELLAYRDVTLTGAMQYRLTPLHRGLYGTPNVAHLTGESFVRLDQASLKYNYDSLYAGRTIYLKFLSFNTLGGHELTLPNVAPISFTLQGLGPGAIDASSGSYLPGLDQVPNGSYVFARTAAHSSYRPLSNPLTATVVGSAVASDTFPGSSLSANWAVGEGNFGVAANKVTITASWNNGLAYAYWVAGGFSADHYSQISVGANAGGQGAIGPAVRCTSLANFYGFYILGSAPDTYVLFKMVNGVPTTLASSTYGPGLNLNDVLRLTVTGTGAAQVLQASVNGSLIASVIDGDLSTGAPGFVSAESFHNPDFEESSVLPPSGWHVTAGDTLTYDTTTQHGGVRSALWTTSVNGNQLSGDKIPVTPGQAISFSGWLKSDGVGSFRIIAQWEDASGAFISAIATGPTTSASWTQVGNSGTVPAGAITLTMGIQSQTTGAHTVDIDDLLVTMTPSVMGALQSGSAWSAGSLAAQVNVAGFFMRSPGFPDVALSSGSIAALVYDTLYFVYYLDLYFLGGAVAYLVSTTKEVVLQNAAAFFVGSIKTPKPSAPDTVGFNDGGVNAQAGIRSRYTFNSVVSSLATSTPPLPTLASLSNATDDDQTSFATLTAPANGSALGNAASINFIGLPQFARKNYSRIVAHIIYDVPTNTLAGASSGNRGLVSIGTPVGGGSAVANFLTKGVTVGLTHFQSDLDIPSTLAGQSQTQVQLSPAPSDAAPQTIVVRIYDAWIDCYE